MKTRYVLVPAAAKELLVTDLNLRAAINRGVIPFIRVGKRIHVDINDLLNRKRDVVRICRGKIGVDDPVIPSRHVISPYDSINLDGVFTAPQVARIFDTSETTIYDWGKEKLLKNCEQDESPRSRWRIPMESVENLLYEIFTNKGRSKGRKAHWTPRIQNRFENTQKDI